MRLLNRVVCWPCSFLILGLVLFFYVQSDCAQRFKRLEPAKVVKVVDGDTLKINYKGNEESVRLIGIDAPESRPNKKAKMDAQRNREDLREVNPK